MTDETARRKSELLSKKAEKLIADEYKKARESVLEEMRKVYEKYAVDGVLTKAEMTKYNRLNSLLARIDEDLTNMGITVDGTIKNLVKDQYGEAFFNYGESLQAKYGSSIDFGLISKDQLSALVNEPNVSGVSLKTTLGNNRYNALLYERQAITQGFMQGESYSGMAKRIKEAFNKSFNDSLRIARTEGHRAASEGQRLAYDRAEEDGVEFEVIWDAANQLGRTRDTHLALNNKKADKDGYFYSSGGKTRYPGGFGIAAEDVNCRCRLRTQIKENT